MKACGICPVLNVINEYPPYQIVTDGVELPLDVGFQISLIIRHRFDTLVWGLTSLAG